MWLVKDWIGITLAVVTSISFCFIDITVTKYGVLNTLVEEDELTGTGIFALILFQTCVCLAVWSYVKLMLTNPGVTPRMHPPSDLPLDQLMNCNVCNQWKPPRAHHCSTCGKCVFKMDRHCVWVNNCVGALNQKFYILFLVYTTAASALSVMVLGYAAMYYGASNKKYKIKPIPVLCGTFSLLISIFIMLLGTGLLLEQMVQIQRNQTSIEKIQKNVPRHVHAK